MSFIESKKYTGSEKQLVEVKNYRIEGGNAHGERRTDISLSSGLSFTVSPDRCMDISSLSYKGVNCSFRQDGKKNGSFLDRANFGMVMTCGIDNLGPAEGDFPMHGSIGTTPAEDYSVLNREGGVSLYGRMESGRLFSHHLSFERSIKCAYGENKIEICDRITNNGEDTVYLLLYHMNMGYPFLAPETEFKIPYKNVTPRDNDAKALDQYRAKMSDIIENVREAVFYYDVEKDENGYANIYAENKNLGFGMKVSYDTRYLKHLIQWIMPGKNEYVSAFEPATSFVEGRRKAIADNDSVRIRSGETHEIKLSIEFYDL